VPARPLARRAYGKVLPPRAVLAQRARQLDRLRQQRLEEAVELDPLP
jgi:hypothetical protein